MMKQQILLLIVHDFYYSLIALTLQSIAQNPEASIKHLSRVFSSFSTFFWLISPLHVLYFPVINVRSLSSSLSGLKMQELMLYRPIVCTALTPASLVNSPYLLYILVVPGARLIFSSSAYSFLSVRSSQIISFTFVLADKMYQ